MPGSAMRIEEAWRVLGLPARPSLRAVKAAYRRLAKSTHPDAIGGAKSAALRFARITEAYAVARAEAIADGRIGADRAAPTPGPAPRPSPRATGAAAPRRSPTADERATRAHPGSTTYDGATEEEPAWDGAAWVGADSGTYWTVNPREYADPRKHGPEYRARGRRPVRRTQRDRTPSPATPARAPSTSSPMPRVGALPLAAALSIGIVVAAEGPLRLAAGALLCATLAVGALRGRRR